MTIQVQINNTDTIRTVKLTLLDTKTGAAVPLVVGDALVKPGETAEQYIHSGRALFVSELEEAAVEPAKVEAEAEKAQ